MSIRKNITMSDKLAGWYEDKANEMGISQSSLMVMALQFYTEYQASILAIREYPDLLKQIKEIEESLNSN